MPSHFILFAGKGGVGKTTCAAAFAVGEAHAGRQVLIVSTDPAHSLGDVFAVPLAARPSEISLKASGRLRAVEFDAPRAFRRWLAGHRQALADIIEHGTLLDREDAQGLLGLSIPGVDELVALLEISRLARATPEPDLVVIDTAPTGHALRLLAAPDTVAAVAQALADLQREHRVIRERFAGAVRPEAADRLIAQLAEQATRTASVLRNRRLSEIHWVMTPERLSLAETEDGLKALARVSIYTSEILVNRALGGGTACPVCENRRAAEADVMLDLRRSIAKGRVVRVVPERNEEPRGVARLAALSRYLHGVPARVHPRKVRGRASTAMSWPSRRVSEECRLSLRPLGNQQVIFVGGKGGVGKTTVAASLAVALARRKGSRRVVLFSTDPAHSVGDVLGIRLGRRPRAVPRAPRNLKAVEFDANRTFAEKRSMLEDALGEISAAVGGGAASLTGPGFGNLLELTPPGVDELLGLLAVADFVAGNPSQTIVADTAPTGHTLRLLEMPDVARGWVQALMRVLLKYREVARPGALARELVTLSQSIAEFRRLITDPARAQFIVVTRAEEMSRLETDDLLKRLRGLHLSVTTVVVNAMTLSPRRCSRCRSRQRAETREVGRLRRAIRGGRGECAIIQTPLAAPPPQGLAALERWASTWIQPHTSIA